MYRQIKKRIQEKCRYYIEKLFKIQMAKQNSNTKQKRNEIIEIIG